LSNNLNDIILESFTEETIGYFEVEIIMGGYYDQIAIGLTTLDQFSPSEFTGYINDSIGYHGDDGKCYVNGTGYTYGTIFGSKDVIGCGVTKSGNVYFVHNSCILPLLDVRLKGPIYPVISLRGKYCSVKIIHDPLQFRFKHVKMAKYKNPLNHLSYSHSFTKLIANDENFLKNIQNIAKMLKSNNSCMVPDDLNKKFKKYALIMHKVCKNNKKNMLKYFILLDEVNKNASDSNKFYENEENFYKNQNVIEKVLMKPIFEPTTTHSHREKEFQPIEMNNNKILQNNNSNLILSSVQGHSQASFYKKQNTSKCQNACGPGKCHIF
jgi:hypothetical protein